MFDIDWRQLAVQSPESLLLCVFLVALLESFAFIGILVPGVVLLVLLGGAALWAGISVWLLLCSAFLGALIGDVVSFGLGIFWSDRLWRSRVWCRYQTLGERAVRFVLRWGWISVLMGRFIGPLRPIVPLVLGALGMSKVRFMLIDLMACLLWAPVYVLPGYSIGAVLKWSERLF